jgi:hypothetical protein
MKSTRTLFFVLAALAIVLVVGFEVSTLAFLSTGNNPKSVRGMGGPYLALLDGLLLYSIFWMAVGHFELKALTARISSVVTLIASLFGAIGVFAAILAAFGLIVLMIGMFMAAPWGTLAYFIAFAGFPKSEAVAALTFIMVLKLAFLVLLALSDLGYLKNKGLLILVGLSLLATWLTSFLISLPPSFLASITDAVGALITAIISFVWLIVIFVMSIVAVIKALKVRAPGREV